MRPIKAVKSYVTIQVFNKKPYRQVIKSDKQSKEWINNKFIIEMDMYYNLNACTFTVSFLFLFCLSPWPRVEVRSRTHDVPHDTCPMSTLYQLSHELFQKVVDFIA